MILVFISSGAMSILGGICMLSILPVTFALNMEIGPKLFLPMVVVGALFFLWQWMDIGTAVAMFDLYMWKYVGWFLILEALLMLLLHRFNFGLLCLHTVLVTAFLVLTLVVWTKADKHPLPDLSATAEIEIQDIRNDRHVVYPDPLEFMDSLEKLQNTRLVGSYWEAVDYQPHQHIYRLSCLDADGKEIVTIHFIDHQYLLMEHGDTIIAYYAPDAGGIPAEDFIEMHDAVMYPAA